MIGQQRIHKGLDSTVCMASMFTAAVALSAPLLGVGNTGWLTTGSGIALALYLGVVTVGIVYTCIGWGLQRLAAPTVLTLTLAEPMTASILAASVLNQAPGAVGWIGTAVVLVALPHHSDSSPGAVKRGRRSHPSVGSPVAFIASAIAVPLRASGLVWRP